MFYIDKMKKIISKMKWSVLAVFFPAVALAQISLPTVRTGPSDLVGTIERVLNITLGLVGLIAVIVMVYGGILLATSGGDEEKTKKGKGFITYSIIGLAVIILSYAIVAWVISTIR